MSLFPIRSHRKYDICSRSVTQQTGKSQLCMTGNPRFAWLCSRIWHNRQARLRNWLMNVAPTLSPIRALSVAYVASHVAPVAPVAVSDTVNDTSAQIWYTSETTDWLMIYFRDWWFILVPQGTHCWFGSDGWFWAIAQKKNHLQCLAPRCICPWKRWVITCDCGRDAPCAYAFSGQDVPSIHPLVPSIHLLFNHFYASHSLDAKHPLSHSRGPWHMRVCGTFHHLSAWNTSLDTEDQEGSGQPPPSRSDSSTQPRQGGYYHQSRKSE